MPVVGSSPMHPLQGCGRSAVPGAATGASTVAPHPTARDRRTTLGSQHFGCHRPHLEHRTSRQNDGHRQPDIGAERHVGCSDLSLPPLLWLQVWHLNGRLMRGGVMSYPVAEIHARANEHSKVRAVRALVGDVRTGLRVQVGDVDVELPRPLVEVLVAAAESFDDGDTIAVVSEEAEVSPAQASKLLGVSRQYVDRLVAKGMLPARKLPNSSYRKIPVRSVLAYREASERKRAGIRRIVDDATAAGLTY